MTKSSWWVWASLVVAVALGGCTHESDGRGVVMLPPEEGAGEESESTLRRPSSRTLGTSTAEPQVAGWQIEAAELHQEAVSRADALARAIAADRCPTAEELRNRICDLAARICEIAEQHPIDEGTGERCADADARCVQASDRVTERCEY